MKEVQTTEKNIPKISIIIPVYNMERYLEKCLSSIQDQSFTDFEVIIVDDGSQDQSSNICREFLKDKRFQYVWQKNAGVSVARNTGLANAKGEWIAFVDPDDSVMSDYLETLYSYCSYGGDIICCCCQFYKDNDQKLCSFFARDTVFSDRSEESTNGFDTERKEVLLRQLMNPEYGESRITAIGVPWGKLYRSELIKGSKLFFLPQLFRLQDNIFNMYAFGLSQKIIYINKGLYLYNWENIYRFGRKYDKRAPGYYTCVIECRKKYLEQNGLMSVPEWRKLYLMEAARLFNNSLTKYYIHPDNPGSVQEVAVELRQFLGQPVYEELLRNIFCIRYPSLGSRLRIGMVKMHLYNTLIYIGRRT